MTKLTSLAVLALLATVAHAQSAAVPIPLGTHEYLVRGFYEGDEMEPWEAELSLADTTVLGRRGIVATYRSRRDGAGFLFTHAASWQRDGAGTMHASWINNGRVPSTCVVDAKAGRVTARPSGTPSIEREAKYDPVPDFSLGAYLASRALSDGDTIRVSVVRCIPSSPNVLEVKDVTATVTSADEPVAGKPEAAWLVSGPTAYPFKVAVAKASHRVLRTVTPQGSVGYSIDLYQKTK